MAAIILNAKSFPTLETNRLVLREITENDAESIYYYLSDEEVMQYFGLDTFTSKDDAKSEILWYQGVYNANKGIRWGITLKGDKRVFGSCGFDNWVHEHSRAEVGAELSKEFWRQGYMSEAFQAILHFGFDEMKLMRIQGLIEPPNIASQKLAEKHGFLREGLLRKYEYSRGKFDDLYMYSLLKEDFRPAVSLQRTVEL